jgi:alpha-L-rhamnosidase
MNLGEWCPAYGFPDDKLVHTYFLWKCAKYTANASIALGKTEEAVRFNALADDVASAFHKVFYDSETKSYGYNNGSNIFALHMGVPEEHKADVVASLKKEIEENGGHLNTGIFGTQIFFDVLCDNGLQEMAYAAMCKKDQPSYGWWLEQGAKTMWEYWDGKKSRNHPMFGGGLTWLYTRIAGLQTDPAEPGYRHIVVRPTPVGDLTWASYETETPAGKAAVRWDIKKGKFILKVRVPDGSHASVYLPGSDTPKEVGAGKHVLTAVL